MSLGTRFVRKPAALAALSPDRPAVIEASAGTGKTYTLEHLVIDLILRGACTLPEILVVTFTEKASSELKARLRAKLRAMLDAPEGPPPEHGDYWTIGQEEQDRLRSALLSFDTATISTIHAFCQRILSDNAFSNLRLFSEQVVDGETAFLRSYHQVLRGPLSTEPELKPYLRAWLSRGSSAAELGHMLAAAHARRAAVDPPFSPGAAAGLWQALKKIPFDFGRLRGSVRRLRLPEADALLVNLQSLHAALTEAEDFPALLEQLSRPLPSGAKAAPARRKHYGPRPSLMEAILEGMSQPELRARDPLAQLREALSALQRIAPSLDSVLVQLALPLVQDHLQKEKAARGEYDFDDMMALVAKALSESPRLRSMLRERYPYALIDEFQDTDEVQWEVFSDLYLGEGASGQLYVIGDPKQAIYAFRGADLRTYLTAREELLAAGGALVQLVDNYRSTPGLLASVNHILDGRAPEPFFTGAVRYDHPTKAAQEHLLGIFEQGEPAEGVVLVELELADHEERVERGTALKAYARWIAEEAARLLSPQKPSLRLRTTDGPKLLRPQDIYVLSRSRAEARQVLSALREVQLPAEIYREEGLFQTPEAEEVLALLRAVADPSQRALRMAAWQTSFFSVDWAALPSCLELPAGHPLMRALFSLKELADARRYEELFAAILRETGRVERGLLLEASGRALTNTLHILEVLQEEASDRRATLDELNQRLAATIEGQLKAPGEEGNVQRISGGRDAVQVMTMHQAKGLEAAVVFLFGGLSEAKTKGWLFHREDASSVAGRGSQRRQWIGASPPEAARVELAEEDQRLLYVALTRAKARLYLPLIPLNAAGEPQVNQLRGSYRALNARLSRCLGAEGFCRRSAPLPRQQAPSEAPPLEAELSWSPSATLNPLPQPEPKLWTLRRAHRGPVLSSYSRIKALHGGYHAPAQTEGEAQLAAPGPEELPGGTNSGLFVHALLEQAPLSAPAGSWAEWMEQPEVKRLAEPALAAFDREPRHWPHAAQMVHDALFTPLTLGGVRFAGGLGGAERVLRELEFTFPLYGEDGLERGLLRGFIDALVEQEGKLFVIDWKTDLLPDYSAEALSAHVALNYSVQAKLYSQAALLLLEVEGEAEYEARFGGAAYVFTRGLAPEGAAGLYFTRPSYAQLEAYMEELKTAPLAPYQEPL